MAYEQPEAYDESADSGGSLGSVSDAGEYDGLISATARYASGLRGPARDEVRSTIPASLVGKYDSYLAIHDDRAESEGGQKQALLDEDAYGRLTARENAARRKLEESAQERGHVRSRIITYEELKNLPRPKPLVWNVVYSGAVGVILGDSQTGKTWVMLSIAAAAASGMQWPVPSADQSLAKPSPIPVLYVAAEDGGSIGARLEHWERAHGANLGAYTFHSHPSSIDLLDSVQIDELCEAIQEKGYRLVIFDTVAASLGGEEEGNPQFSKVVQHMRKVVKAMNGEGAAFLVHHFGKDKTKGGRGGSSLFNDSDVVWELDGTLDSMTMRCKKWKADSVRAPWFLRLDREDSNAVHITSTNAPSAGVAGVPTDKHAMLVENIHKAVKTFAADNQGYGPSGSTIAGYLRKNNVQFTETHYRDALAIMVSDGELIMKKAPRNSRLYRLPPTQDGLPIS